MKTPIQESPVKKSALDVCSYKSNINNESAGDDEINWFGGVAKSVTQMMTMPQKLKYKIVA